VRRSLAALLSAGMLGAAALAVPASAATTSSGHCARQSAIQVPGAGKQVVTCVADLSLPQLVAQGLTDASDWAGLAALGTKNPVAGPGLQVDGYFADDDSTLNAEHGWSHDSQFVIRLPDHWNGKLVVTGAPGVRKQYADDQIFSDWFLARGYAYASIDKGNSGVSFYDNASRSGPGQPQQEWNYRVTELTKAVKQVVQQRYGRRPARTYMTGISNGGYLTRWQLENRPDLYDGGVDWEGTLFLAAGPNVLTYLPTAIKNYPTYAATGSKAAHDAIIKAGFAPGSEFLWRDHETEYWDLTQRTYRESFDPTYDGALKAGIPFCASGTPNCDADYNYAKRPAAVHRAVGSVSLTGKIGKPMLTLHGGLDALLPIRTDSDVYIPMVRNAGRGALSRYYVIQAGNHVDGRYDLFPNQLRPILPCYRSAFADLELWVERGTAPPTSQSVAKPNSGDVVNSCSQLAPRSVRTASTTTAASPTGSGTTGGTAAGTTSGSSTTGTTGTGSGAVNNASDSRSLAATGLNGAVSAVGLLALLSTGLLYRRRRA